MSEIDNSLLSIQNPSDTSLEDLGSRTKIQKEWEKIPYQKYVGESLLGNLHGHGFYLVEHGDKLFYDGLFYANKLEGYAQVFYNDGSNFQGLFKNNLRFGPGVLTYPNGEQDVGLWNGQRLLRLASVNLENLIPRLATTPDGQLKLLKYRYLVPVCPKRTDVAYDILQGLGASENILKRSHELYNLEVENKHNIFFNNKLFNEQFYGDQDFYIEIALTEEEAKSLPGDSYTESKNSVNSSDVNVERAKQIKDELQIIDNKLKAAKKRRLEVQKKVEYCRACCFREQREEESAAPFSGEYEDDEDDASLESTPSAVPSVVPKISNYSKKSDISKSMAIEDIDTDALFIDEENSTTSLFSFDSEISTQSDDVMSQIKNYLMDTCQCNEAMYVGDLYELEQELEAVIKDELFFETIGNNLKHKLEKHLSQTEDATKVKTKKILVNYVLSWNNEKYCRRMLKQSFLHRKSEYMVNFKVSDLIAGNRSQFEAPGQRERNCTDYLTACSSGDIRIIYEHIKKNDINVNVCDGKGNNGVFYAAKNDRVDVIQVLVNLGAKLDHQNDEGLLPLSMCLLMFLARKHKVESWEKSFLSEGEPFREREKPYKWYSNMSLLNMLMNPSGSLTSATKSRLTSKSKSEKTYLFDTSFIVPPTQKAGQFMKDVVGPRRMSFAPSVDMGTKSIEKTIAVLLQFGANPNAGSSPLPPLFLSLFTENPSIVENILEARADVNTTIEDDMTSLHVIASSKCTRENVCICHLLISYDCDPRLKTSPNHWKEQKIYIMGKQVNPNVVEDYGKNPLHILCIRKDFVIDYCSFFSDMVLNFRDSSVDFNDTYLGHTPLSLAVLVGNKILVEVLMDQYLIDPHQVLGYDMGNVVTIYTLKRYEDIIPPNAIEILDYMVGLGVNVLTPVGDFQNSIEFMENEHETFIEKTIKKSTTHKRGKKKGGPQEDIMDYIRELGRDAIIKCIQLLAAENLYNFIEDEFTGDNCVAILAGYLTPTLAVSNLQLLFNHGRIKPDRFNKNICLQLVNMVKTNLNRKKKMELKQDSQNSKTDLDQDVVMDATDYGFILNMTDFTKMEKKKLKVNLVPPGLDNISKYKVCFHCLRKSGKNLLVCPRCQLVHFCSISCNKENLQLKLHPCNTNFYASELERLSSTRASWEPENLAELYEKVRENCEKRRLERLQKYLELERKHLEEKKKSDKYGTKLLKKMNLPRHALDRSPTLNSLLGSLCVFNVKSEICEHEHDCRDSIANKTYSGSIRWDLSSREVIKKTCSTRKHSNLLEKIDRQRARKKKDATCHCKECIECGKEGKAKCTCASGSKKTRIKIKTQKVAEEVTLKKLRVIPQRCEEFTRLLTGYFPNHDFSSVLLPYVCYSNGHLYYKFLDNDYNITYSMM